MLNLLIIRQTFICEVLLLFNISIQYSSQVFPIHVVYGISFDFSFIHIYEIRRLLQPIYSLQSDSCLPVLGAFLLRRLSLSEILIEGCELVDIIFSQRSNA